MEAREDRERREAASDARDGGLAAVANSKVTPIPPTHYICECGRAWPYATMCLCGRDVPGYG